MDNHVSGNNSQLKTSVIRKTLNFYTGNTEKDSIEYWQKYVFYIIALSGFLAGTICIIPSTIWLALTGRPIGVFLILPYLLNSVIILKPGISIKVKTLIIALNFQIIGIFSILLGGPTAEAGLWFSVGTLLISLFVNFKTACLSIVITFFSVLTLAFLHLYGIISWPFLAEYRFFSWIIKIIDIVMINLCFATANSLLIKGVDSSFTSLRKSEMRVKKLLYEKETLIREVYHRSKNNLQVVSSLLNLNSARIDDECSRQIFKDIGHKINAMSLVHQKLYNAEDLSNICMSEYIQDLTSLLMEGYCINPEKIKIELNLENIYMLIDLAIPCGLVINEIISNSFKYAFMDDREGRIVISLTTESNESFHLDISDDGIGVGENFSLDSDKKMGMETIFTIVRQQLKGSIELITMKGVAYRISFKRGLYARRI